jgi:hypothetical protein
MLGKDTPDGCGPATHRSLILPYRFELRRDKAA